MTDPLLTACAKALVVANQWTPDWAEEVAALVLLIARPAILEEAAKVCELPAFGVDTLIDGTGHKWSRPANGSECAARIRALAAKDTP